MKPFGVIILAFLLLTQTFSKWMVLLEYQVNKDYIAQNLCINKSKPVLHCNGKCQLAKKLAADEDAAKTNTGHHTLKTALSEILFVNPLPLLEVSRAVTMLPAAYTGYQTALCSAPLSPVFHPPGI